MALLLLSFYLALSGMFFMLACFAAVGGHWLGLVLQCACGWINTANFISIRRLMR